MDSLSNIMGNRRQTKVAIWNVPRTASTVLTKCLSGIDGIEVFFELYTAAAICKSFFTRTTGRDLPMDITGNEDVYEEERKICEEKYKLTFNSRKLSFQQIKEDLEHCKSRYVLSKGNFKGLDSIDSVVEYLPKGFRHTFLIRNPFEVFVSARKACLNSLFEQKDKDSFDLTSDDPTCQQLKIFQQMHQLWKYVRENDLDADPVVIDASDLLSRPRATMKAYCEAVGFPFSDDLLRWESNPTRMPDNVVTPSDLYFVNYNNFYGRALQSTGFVAPLVSGPISRDQLTNDVTQCADQSMPFYQEMYEHRLQPKD